jgi:hypothetical protein
MAKPQFTRQVIGWIEIDPADQSSLDESGLDAETNLVAIFARWAGEGSGDIDLLATRADGSDSTPAGSAPANSAAPRRRLKHNAAKRDARRTSRFPRRVRADVSAIATELDAQLVDFQRRLIAAS